MIFKIRLAVAAAKRIISFVLIGFSLVASSASAAVIDLDFNSLPSAQAWTFSANSNELDVFSVNGTALHQNSLGLVDDPRYVWQEVVERKPFDLQFRARLTEFGGPQPYAYAFSVLLGAGDFFVYVGLGPGFVEIEENVSTYQRVFIDTSQFHDYRLLGDPEAGRYRFFIDGNEVLSRIIGNNPLDSHFLMIGDRILSFNDAPVGATADLTRFVFDYVNVAKQVAIDIKPESDTNFINPRSRGKISVAILTTDIVDATVINTATVRFGVTGTEAAPVQIAVKYINGDDRPDLLLHFKTQDTGIQCGETSASLTGKTFEGEAVEGSDSIKTVGCRE